MRQLAGTTARITQQKFTGSGVCRSDGDERHAFANVAVTLRRDEPRLSYVNLVKPVGRSIASSINVDCEAALVC